MKRMNFVIACLRPSQNVKLGIFTGSRAVDGKEMYKKAWCTSKIVVLSCQAIWISHRRRILIVIRQKQNILRSILIALADSNPNVFSTHR